MLSESDLILCTIFEFFEEKNQEHLKKYSYYKAKQFVMTKISKKSLHILEGSASGVQVGDIEQVIVQNSFKILSNYMKLMILYTLL